jgi:predicted helicase
MTTLTQLLNTYREAAQTEREKGSYFEELICTYLRNEPTYQDLYEKVWLYSDWARENDLDARDTGIDLVAKTQGTNEYHAIQCKLYAENYRLRKEDIDSFFTASGKKIFSHRIIVSTTNNWNDHAEAAIQDQNPPVTKIDLNDLENSKIDWAKYQPEKEIVFKPKKTLREHQVNALDGVEAGLKIADRGKLIMACGTGKTFTGLKIAEKLAGANKRVLFLVPSLSLLSQTLSEWTQETHTPLHSFAVCSDSDVGKKRKKDDDIVQTFTHELRYPATTDSKSLANAMAKRHDNEHMTVVFSTYHSIDVIGKAQKEFDLPDFDLIICDEAHRTTGATFGDDDESSFVKVHSNDNIQAKKRLYMTATPRIYGELAKATADKESLALCSMDDESLFGKELYVINFSEAVKRDLLVDYKVIVLAIDEAHISGRLQKLLSSEDNSLKVDDAAKIIGCWKALSKQGATTDFMDDASHMRRAVAFCQVIEPSTAAKTHKVSSKNIANMFKTVVDSYQEQEVIENPDVEDIAVYLGCEAEHIDGSMNASQKEEKLNWLKAEPDEYTCRILSNVRCLSEGVDVPALDAVLFLTPRNSQVDVVQSVGRVMRKAEGKKRGYVILPVVIPAGVEPDKALDDNKTYKVVWQVLQALRSHDDRFDAMINKLDYIGKDVSKMEVIAITDNVNHKSKTPSTGKPNTGAGKGGFNIGENPPEKPPEQIEMQFEIGTIERAIYAKVVKKCGNRSHWEDWANDIAKIAQTHITRIRTILENPQNTIEISAFENFLTGLRAHLNPSIGQDDAIEMLAQHLITKPVFDSLFEGYAFTEHNPVSLAMQSVLEVLQSHHLNKEADTLQLFYDSVKERVKGINNASGKQKIITELYDKFFKTAFPRMAERLGIVYTPVEVVDFIIHSADDALKQEFGVGLTDEGVHILDPFTGTGTFMVRLLQSGLIQAEDLARKYQKELHANEIILLAYYIAAINIEETYHDLSKRDYEPFQGIVLTDTFQLAEGNALQNSMSAENSERAKRQKLNDIRVIIGNPPYSAGQTSENDNNQNLKYEQLDNRIRNTYAEHSTGVNKNSLYDSYIRGIRWASDRIKDKGMVCYVSNGAFIDSNAMDGLRKSLTDEFSRIYCFNLRGNIRKFDKAEGQNIFGSASMTPVAITLLIKNPKHKDTKELFYYDIGDCLTQKEKLEIISKFKSIDAISWQKLTPNDSNDWINQRSEEFENFVELGNKEDKKAKTIFDVYSLGVSTNRDTWAYNSSRMNLNINIKRMIDFYNSQIEDLKLGKGISNDPTKISWSSSLKNCLERGLKIDYRENACIHSMYRPFLKQWLYFDGRLNHRVGQFTKIFPYEANFKNLVICVSGVGNRKDFSILISDVLPDLHMVDSNGANQCFPLYTYEKIEIEESGLFDTPAESGYRKKENITDAMLSEFRTQYADVKISKEDIFYYVYGVLHSPEYKTRFASDLKKMLPRIPYAKNFWAFSVAGRNLAALHLNYETIEPYPLTEEISGSVNFTVEKMKFPSKADKSKIIYNGTVTLSGIPLEAYEYVVNGKSAIEWIMERYAVTVDKDSGIKNNPNNWSDEPRYILDLVKRIVAVSVGSVEIVKGLPKLDEQK